LKLTRVQEFLSPERFEIVSEEFDYVLDCWSGARKRIKISPTTLLSR
jgi:hypothetical protein